MKKLVFLIFVLNIFSAYGEDNGVPAHLEKLAKDTYNNCIEEDGKDPNNEDDKADCSKKATNACVAEGNDCDLYVKGLMAGDSDKNIDAVIQTFTQIANSNPDNLKVNLSINKRTAWDCFSLVKEDYLSDDPNWSTVYKDFIADENIKSYITDTPLASIKSCNKITSDNFLDPDSMQVMVSSKAVCKYFLRNAPDPSVRQRIYTAIKNYEDIEQVEHSSNYKQELESIGGVQEYANFLASGCAALHTLTAKISMKTKQEGLESSYEPLDKSFKCTKRLGSSYPFAIDFVACKEALDWYNVNILVNDVVVPAATTVTQTVQANNITTQQTSDLASGGVDAQTAALNAQKKTYEMKANAEVAQSVTKGTTSAFMFSKFSTYPTPAVVTGDWCLSGSAELGLSREVACGVSYMLSDETVEAAIFANQKAKTVLMYAGATLLSEAITHTILAAGYNKQAKMVGSVVDTIEDTEESLEENALTEDEIECLTDASADGCTATISSSTASTPGFDISFGTTSGVSDSSLGSAELDSSTGTANSAVSDPTTDAQIALDDFIGSEAETKAGNDFTKIGAANTTDGGSGSGGSAGGGAGGSVGGGGSGGDAAAKKSAGDKSALGGKVSSTYTKGGNNIFGSGGSVSSSKSNKNSFDSLLKNSGSRSVASEIEKTILPQSIQLFDAISKRYAKITEDKRIDVDLTSED